MSRERLPEIVLLVLPPLPRERRKRNLVMLLHRSYRSKWWRVECVNEAKACKSNACRHVEAVCLGYARCRPEFINRREAV